MEDAIKDLRKAYNDYRMGNMDSLMVKEKAIPVLEEARMKGDRKLLQEVERILLDLDSHACIK